MVKKKNIVKKNMDGSTIIEIAKKPKISRNTVPVILTELKIVGLIKICPIGKSRSNYFGSGR